MRRVCLALLGATLAACQAVSTPSTLVGRTDAAGLASARPQSNLTAPLAHEGGIVFIKPITATEWGTKDFYVEDPDGNIISFGGRPAAG